MRQPDGCKHVRLGCGHAGDSNPDGNDTELAGRRPWWTIILPGLLVIYNAVEFVLDCLMKFDFRHLRWLDPYLGLYYLALMGMIGYSFAIGKPFGFITLTTYFINLAATAYSYTRV
jgi:hypothetical protein